MRDSNIDKVADFMKAMEQPVSQGFTDRRGIRLGMTLIEEELNELKTAVQLLDRWQSYTHPAAQETLKGNVIKELTDLCYVVYWLAAKIGIDLDRAFSIIHESNMSKLDNDGKPVKRVDGKILKGPNYKAPDLSHIIRYTPIAL